MERMTSDDAVALAGELERHLRHHFERVKLPIRQDAAQAGIASLLESLEREWFRAGVPGLAERYFVHASSRARRYVRRAMHVGHVERSTDPAVLEQRHLEPFEQRAEAGALAVPTPVTEQPEYLVGNDDLGRQIQVWFDGLPIATQDHFAPLLMPTHELARELGISHQSAGERQAVLRRQLHAAAVSAGFLSGIDGKYDSQTCRGDFSGCTNQ
jgi:hypothetical protein